MAMLLVVSTLCSASASIHDDAMRALSDVCIRNRSAVDGYEYEWCHEKHVHQYHTSVPIVMGTFAGTHCEFFSRATQMHVTQSYLGCRHEESLSEHCSLFSKRRLVWSYSSICGSQIQLLQPQSSGGTCACRRYCRRNLFSVRCELSSNDEHDNGSCHLHRVRGGSLVLSILSHRLHLAGVLPTTTTARNLANE